MAETQMESRWLFCSTPARDKWHTVFQISGFTALWRMCHGCQKTIKKPLWGNAFANPAPDTATGCTLAYESGMHQLQPWSRKDSLAAGMHPGPSPVRRFCIWFFFFLNIWRIWLKKTQCHFFSWFPYYCWFLRNKCLKTIQLLTHKLCLFAVLLSLRCWSCPHSHMQRSCSSHPRQLQRFCISKCVLCGMQAYHSALSGFWGQVICKLCFLSSLQCASGNVTGS